VREEASGRKLAEASLAEATEVAAKLKAELTRASAAAERATREAAAALFCRGLPPCVSRPRGVGLTSRHLEGSEGSIAAVHAAAVATRRRRRSRRPCRAGSA
jgi:hypothetical protein